MYTSKKNTLQVFIINVSSNQSSRSLSKRRKQSKQKDADIAPTTTHLYKQQSVCHYTHNNCCHTCGYEIEKNTNVDCKW